VRASGGNIATAIKDSRFPLHEFRDLFEAGMGELKKVAFWIWRHRGTDTELPQAIERHHKKLPDQRQFLNGDITEVKVIRAGDILVGD
jgi:hypothetical protein